MLDNRKQSDVVLRKVNKYNLPHDHSCFLPGDIFLNFEPRGPGKRNQTERKVLMELKRWKSKAEEIEGAGIRASESCVMVPESLPVG